MEYHLHSNGRDCGESIGTESPHIEHEDMFARAITDIITKALDINWRDRRIVEGLIYTSIKEHFTVRGKLLEQYLHTQLDIIAKKMRLKFDIPQNIRVNYSSSVYAKFNDLFDAIKHKYEKDGE